MTLFQRFSSRVGVLARFVVVAMTMSLAVTVSSAGLSPSAVNAAASKGQSKCSRAGARAVVKGKPAVCTQTSNGLRWVATPVTTGATRSTATTAPATTTVVSTTTATATTATATTLPASTSRSGALNGAMNYRASGTVELVNTNGVGVLNIRGSDISSGPNLAVWLTPSAGALNVTGAVRLGPLTSLTGNHSYPLPPGVNPAAYSGVLIWCDRFGVPFGSAPLQ